MARKPVDLKKWLIPQLRRISMAWPPKSIARDRYKQKVQIGFYKNGNPEYKVLWECANCSELVEKTDGAMDHITPVIDLDGFTNWDDHINTLLCGDDNFQHLCKACHYIKTQEENITRAENRKKKKDQLK